MRVLKGSAAENMHRAANPPQKAISSNRRILIIDDNAAIHADFKKVLFARDPGDEQGVAALEAALFGEEADQQLLSGGFAVDSAFQGQEGLQCVEKAVAEGRPYAMAFVDVRMPPGWDGIETTERLWQADPSLQIVICTAYSDYSWDAMTKRLGQTDRLVILKKPFDPIEVLQLAYSLTEKWRLSREAQLRMDQLENMVAERTAALRSEIETRKGIEADLARALNAAETANRAKSDFLANMSHEIRTPMNGVLGMCQLLLDADLSPDLRDIVKTLATSGEVLLSVINDILDFSKIEANKLALESMVFSVEEVVEDAVQILAPSAAEKDIELISVTDSRAVGAFIGDPTRLSQILLNLLSNAIKFTSEGEVCVQVECLAEEGEQARLRFSVRDTGIGLPPESLASLFEPFTQADTSITRRFGGTGLGLAICKRLVDMMNGSISAESEMGKGATFSFELPLPRAREKLASASGIEEKPFAGMRMLIVDDNATNRKYLARLVAAWGGQTEEAVDGNHALRVIGEGASPAGDFDIILLDYQMPEMNGLALAGHIRERLDDSTPRMILLTSHHEIPGEEELASLGVGAALFKPLRKNTLLNGFLKALGRDPRSARAPLLPAKGRKGNSSQLPPARILLAEDNAVNQRVALLHLKSLGYQADVAGNGREAVAAVRQNVYDLVFMDCQMPELDGFEATRQIRAHERQANLPRLPIIAMTAGVGSGYREDCFASGMDDYIAKPIRKEELRDVIVRLLAPAAL